MGDRPMTVNAQLLTKLIESYNDYAEIYEDHENDAYGLAGNLREIILDLIENIDDPYARRLAGYIADGVWDPILGKVLDGGRGVRQE